MRVKIVTWVNYYKVRAIGNRQRFGDNCSGTWFSSSYNDNIPWRESRFSQLCVKSRRNEFNIIQVDSIGFDVCRPKKRNSAWDILRGHWTDETNGYSFGNIAQDNFFPLIVANHKPNLSRFSRITLANRSLSANCLSSISVNRSVFSSNGSPSSSTAAAPT